MERFIIVVVFVVKGRVLWHHQGAAKRSSRREEGCVLGKSVLPLAHQLVDSLFHVWMIRPENVFQRLLGFSDVLREFVTLELPPPALLLFICELRFDSKKNFTPAIFVEIIGYWKERLNLGGLPSPLRSQGLGYQHAQQHSRQCPSYQCVHGVDCMQHAREQPCTLTACLNT
jgi:hypothetical protein